MFKIVINCVFISLTTLSSRFYRYGLIGRIITPARSVRVGHLALCSLSYLRFLLCRNDYCVTWPRGMYESFMPSVRVIINHQFLIHVVSCVLKLGFGMNYLPLCFLLSTILISSITSLLPLLKQLSRNMPEDGIGSEGN